MNTAEAPHAPIRPRNILLELTSACNLHCRYCFVSAGGSQEARPYPPGVLARIVGYLRSAGGTRIAVSGGEPLMTPNIWELLDWLVPRISVHLTSNGTLIDAGVAKRLAAYPELRVAVSLDSTDPEVNDATRGAGAATRALSAIDHLVAAGMAARTDIRMVLTRYSVGSVIPMLRFVKSKGLRSLNTTTVVACGRAAGQLWDLVPGLDQFRSLTHELLDDPEHRFLALSLSNVLPLELLRAPLKGGNAWPGCPFGESLRIDVRGNVYPCLDLTQDRYILGNVFEKDIAEVVEHAQSRIRELIELSRVRPKHIPQCRSCEWEVFCAGGCLARAEHLHGGACNPDDLCRYRLQLFEGHRDHFRRRLADERAGASE